MPPHSISRRRDANRYVSERLRELRAERGLSQREAGELLTRASGSKWTFQAVSRAELCRGTYIRRWSVDDLYTLATTFDVPVSYFLPNEVPPGRGPAVEASVLRQVFVEDMS